MCNLNDFVNSVEKYMYSGSDYSRQDTISSLFFYSQDSYICECETVAMGLAVKELGVMSDEEFFRNKKNYSLSKLDLYDKNINCNLWSEVYDR